MTDERTTIAQLVELSRLTEAFERELAEYLEADSPDAARRRLLAAADLIGDLDDQALMFVATAAETVRAQRTAAERDTDAEHWNPWAELRRRRHLRLEWRDLPRTIRGAWIPSATGATIVLATWLSWREMNATLTHELVHDERRIATSILAPDDRDAEETVVRAITAARLDTRTSVR